MRVGTAEGPRPRGVLILRRAWSSRGRPNGDNLPIVCDGSQRVPRAIRPDRHVAGASEPPNKGMKLTRPSILEPCSLSPVLGELVVGGNVRRRCEVVGVEQARGPGRSATR
jgi:hypothetical protein